MNHFQSRHNDLKQLIDQITHDIVNAIRENEFLITQSLITKRYDYISELVSLVSTNEDKHIILKYLSEFQQCDAIITKFIQNEQNSLIQ